MFTSPGGQQGPMDSDNVRAKACSLSPAQIWPPFAGTQAATDAALVRAWQEPLRAAGHHASPDPTATLVRE